MGRALEVSGILFSLEIRNKQREWYLGVQGQVSWCWILPLGTNPL